jgi:hypothetical protein
MLIAIAVAAILLPGILLTGCERVRISTESGTLTTRDYDITGFTAVDVSSAFDVVITPSSTYSVTVTAGENMFDDIKVEKQGDTLRIFVEGLHIPFGGRTLEAKITMPELRGLELSGATEGTVTGFKSAANFNAEISGASSLNIDIETGNADFNISGASEVTGRLKSAGTDMTVSGAAQTDMEIDTGSFKGEISGAGEVNGTLKSTATDINLTGASDVELTGSGGDLKLNGSGASEAFLASLNIQDADITLTGASHADITTNGELSVTLSGASQLNYGGSPTLGDNIEISGGSSLNRR